MLANAYGRVLRLGRHRLALNRRDVRGWRDERDTIHYSLAKRSCAGLRTAEFVMPMAWTASIANAQFQSRSALLLVFVSIISACLIVGG